ncbi:hypothetical protein TIFTF001_047762, partial [Ficus carica]
MSRLSGTVRFTGLGNQSLLSSTLSKNQNTLSLTLQHYFPLAGTLTWPSNSPKPVALYKPSDAVSLTVAEFTVEHYFNHISGDHVREASESRPLVPDLHVNETSASIMALQITLFPDGGICDGVTCHHAFLDGKSIAMTPLGSHAVPKPTAGEFQSKQKVFEHWSETHEPSHTVRGTFQLTLGDIEKLEKRISNHIKISKLEYLSSFVVTSARLWTCIFKAMSSSERKSSMACFVVGVDYQARLGPPTPLNYFGNCAGSHLGYVQARDCFEEDGLAIVAEKI